MKKIMMVVLVILIQSCDEAKEHSTSNIASIDTSAKIQVIEQKQEFDSLTSTNSYYYLSDQPLEKVANLILIDSVHPSDNKITFDCMDSLCSCRNETRELYYKVFIKIIDKADGALSEAVGSYALSYVEKHTEEFIRKTPKKYVVMFGDFCGYELGFTPDQGKSWVQSFQEKTKTYNEKDKKVITDFLKQVNISIKQVNEE